MYGRLQLVALFIDLTLSQIEYTLVAIDRERKKTRLHLTGPDILGGLQVYIYFRGVI